MSVVKKLVFFFEKMKRNVEEDEDRCSEYHHNGEDCLNRAAVKTDSIPRQREEATPQPLETPSPGTEKGTSSRLCNELDEQDLECEEETTIDHIKDLTLKPGLLLHVTYSTTSKNRKYSG